MSNENQNQETPSPPGHEEWRAEMNETLRSLQGLATTMALGKRKENNWLTIKRTFFGTLVLSAVLFYALFYARMLGFQTDPITESVARVKIEGDIAASRPASAEKVVPLIERACKAKHVSALLLDINSGGGTPSESERMISAIEMCRKPVNGSKPKKVYAVINGVGASAAYMIAMHADEVFAGRYSMVGSIGAIIRYPDISKLAHKFGVHEKAFRSAPLKGGPSMFSGSTPEDDEAFQTLVSNMGKTFLEEVKASRKGRLKISDELLFSGRVWTAREALDFGMIDRIAVLEDLKDTTFKGMAIHDYKQKSSFAEGVGFKAAMRDVLAEAMEPTIE